MSYDLRNAKCNKCLQSMCGCPERDAKTGNWIVDGCDFCKEHWDANGKALPKAKGVTGND